MPKTRKQKEKIVEKLTDDINRSKSIILTNYQGLTVKELENLRDIMRREDVSYIIVKNTLFEVAKQKSDLKDLKIDKISGQIAVALGYKEEVSPARLIFEFAKDNKNMEILAGILDGKYISKEEVEYLAKLPSKQELIAKTIRTINAPISGFVNALAGNLRGIINIINSIKDQKAT